MSFSSALITLCSLLLCSPFAGSKSQQVPSIIPSDRGSTIVTLENWIVGFTCCRPSRSKQGTTLMKSLTYWRLLTILVHTCCPATTLTWSCRDSLWPVPRCHRSRRSKGPPVRRGGPPALWPGSTCGGLGKEQQQCRPPRVSPLSAPEDTQDAARLKTECDFQVFLTIQVTTWHGKRLEPLAVLKLNKLTKYFCFLFYLKWAFFYFFFVFLYGPHPGRCFGTIMILIFNVSVIFVLR